MVYDGSQVEQVPVLKVDALEVHSGALMDRQVVNMTYDNNFVSQNFDFWSSEMPEGNNTR